MSSFIKYTFKKGDKVRVTKTEAFSHQATPGLVGIIYSDYKHIDGYNEKWYYSIKFPNFDYPYSVREDFLELETPIKPEGDDWI